jgi:hypothetical protein
MTSGGLGGIVYLARASFLFLMSLVATVGIGCDSYGSAGAATAPSSHFCTSIAPAVQASQQLKPLLADMNSGSVAKDKSQLLIDMSTILRAFHSVKVQLRSAPADAQSSFKWDVMADGKVNAALGLATTRGHIRRAVGKIVGSHPEEGPFIVYIASQCENAAPSETAATS